MEVSGTHEGEERTEGGAKGEGKQDGERELEPTTDENLAAEVKRLSAKMEAELQDASPWGQHAPVYRLAALAAETSMEVLGEDEEEEEGEEGEEDGMGDLIGVGGSEAPFETEIQDGDDIMEEEGEGQAVMVDSVGQETEEEAEMRREQEQMIMAQQRAQSSNGTAGFAENLVESVFQECGVDRMGQETEEEIEMRREQ